MSTPISGTSDTSAGSSVAAVIAQMRAIQSQATAMPDAKALLVEDQQSTSAAEKADFRQLFSSALSSVNELQQTSSALSRGFVNGEHQDLVSASIASQKSSLAFQAVVTARNRMVAAYQDIMNMPI